MQLEEGVKSLGDTDSAFSLSINEDAADNALDFVSFLLT